MKNDSVEVQQPSVNQESPSHQTEQQDSAMKDQFQAVMIQEVVKPIPLPEYKPFIQLDQNPEDDLPNEVLNDFTKYLSEEQNLTLPPKKQVLQALGTFKK